MQLIQSHKSKRQSTFFFIKNRFTIHIKHSYCSSSNQLTRRKHLLLERGSRWWWVWTNTLIAQVLVLRSRGAFWSSSLWGSKERQAWCALSEIKALVNWIAFMEWTRKKGEIYTVYYVITNLEILCPRRYYRTSDELFAAPISLSTWGLETY